MPPATNRTQRKRPGDLTGVRGQQLAAEAAQQKEESARQVQSALEDERHVKLNTEVDYSTPAPFYKQSVAGPDGEVVIEDIVVEKPTRRIRVNYPIEEMTFGREVLRQQEYDEHGNVVAPAILGNLKSYTFEEGRWYIVDSELADHLAFLGYIYE